MAPVTFDRLCAYACDIFFRLPTCEYFFSTIVSSASIYIHLINSGATTLDGTGQQTDEKGEPAMKPCWEITEKEMEKCLEATTWYPANRDYFRGGGFSSNFLYGQQD